MLFQEGLHCPVSLNTLYKIFFIKLFILFKKAGDFYMPRWVLVNIQGL